MEKLTIEGVIVVGINGDSVDSHQNFIDKHALNFSLLADEDNSVSVEYGAWGEKDRDGVTTYGIRRTTFLINESGHIGRVWTDVQADGPHGASLHHRREDLGTDSHGPVPGDGSDGRPCTHSAADERVPHRLPAADRRGPGGAGDYPAAVLRVRRTTPRAHQPQPGRVAGLSPLSGSRRDG